MSLTRSERAASLLGRPGQLASTSIGLLGLVALILAVVAFGRTVQETAINETSFAHQATFRYSAEAPPSIYDGGVLETGDPIYTDAVGGFMVTLNYEFESADRMDVRGAYRLDAIVRNEDGWSSEIQLVPATPFAAREFEISAPIDLGEVRKRIERFEGATDGVASAFALTVTPEVIVDGPAGEPPLAEFTPGLDFQITDSVIRLIEPATARRGDGISISASGTSIQSEPVENAIPLLIGDIDVRTARELSIIGLALAIACGLALILMVREAMTAPEPVQIAARHGARLVDLRGANLKSNGRLVEVACFDDLLKVAGRGDRHVLHFQKNGSHYYFVPTSEVVYGYRTGMTPEPDSGVEASMPERTVRWLRSRE